MRPGGRSATQEAAIDESSDFDFSVADAVRRTTQEEEDYGYQEFRLSSATDAALDAVRAHIVGSGHLRAVAICGDREPYGPDVGWNIGCASFRTCE